MSLKCVCCPEFIISLKKHNFYSEMLIVGFFFGYMVVSGNAAFHWVALLQKFTLSTFHLLVDFFSASILAHSRTKHGKEKTKLLNNQLWI